MNLLLKAQPEAAPSRVTRTGLILAMLSLASGGAHAAPGDLDSTFGSGGVSTADVRDRADGYRERTTAISVRPDGRLLIGGSYSGSGHFVHRFNADGSLDTSFGPSGQGYLWGFVDDDGSNRNSAFNDLITTRTGEFIATGHRQNGSDRDFFLIKYEEDGTAPDSTFGDDHDSDGDYDGWVQFDGGNGNDEARAVAMGPLGRIAIAGAATGPADQDFGLVVLSNYGKSNASTTPGLVTFDFYGGDDIAEAVIFQPDGKILVGGTVDHGLRGNDFGLARFEPDGTLDPTFGTDHDGDGTPDGWVSFDVRTGSDDRLVGLAILPDGKIIAGGSSDSRGNGDRDFTFVSFTPDGAGAWQTGAIETPGVHETAHDMRLRPDGKVLIAGNRADGEAALGQVEVATFLSADPDFGTAGYVHFRPEAGYRSDARAVALQPDGKPVVSGSSYDAGDHTTMAAFVTRLEGAALDLTPSPFCFNDCSSLEADPNTTYVSDPVTVSGLGAGVAVPANTIANQEMRINGGAWRSRESGWVGDGDTVELRVTSGASTGDTSGGTLQMGGFRPANQARLRLGAWESNAFRTVVGGDGVDPSVEDAAPNGGDGNGDGRPDSEQANVASLPTTNGSYLTASFSPDCAVSNVTVQPPSPTDPAFTMPFGMVGFEADGCNSVDVSLHFHGTDSLNGYSYRKNGATPATGFDPNQAEWYTLGGVNFGSTSIGGNPVAVAEFTLRDNELGDSSSTTQHIVDPGGPARPLAGAAAARIPTLSQWALILLATLTGLLGARRILPGAGQGRSR